LLATFEQDGKEEEAKRKEEEVGARCYIKQN